MSTRWGLTVDCASPTELAAFWALALGYVSPPPPAGYASWEQWFTDQNVPPEEWGDAAYLADPAGVLPSLSFMRVPEPKVVKNRLHIDVQAGGGRDQPWEERRLRVVAAVQRLVAAGATVIREDVVDGRLDHVVLADPEGNEFDVV
jgi:Glyoxalase-like domain